MKGSVINVPGAIRAKEIGDGVCELVKEPDVLCIVQERKKRRHDRIIMTLFAVGVFGGLAAALVILAPALGTILFAVVAWCGFAAYATGE